MLSSLETRFLGMRDDCSPLPQDQYGFIHDAVLESLICGETQIPAQNLPKVMGQLASTDSKHGKTGYEVQFGVSTVYSKYNTNLT